MPRMPMLSAAWLIRAAQSRNSARPRPASLPGAIYRETGEQSDGDRVGHIAPEPAKRVSDANRARGDGVIGDDAAVFCDDESAGRTAGLVGTRALLQPVVERRNARGEFRQLVRIGKRLRFGERHGYSQGAAV